jgi:hypothetical protein
MRPVEQIERAKQAERLKEADWTNLLRQIKRGKCTPFIGGEACTGMYPSKSEIAKEWAIKNNFPLGDAQDLSKVAQFLAVNVYEAYPIEQLIESFEKVKQELAKNAAIIPPHRTLANLPLPVYITTNYDDSMERSLRELTLARDPLQEYCRWRKGKSHPPTVFTGDYMPTVANPLVYHLYGHIDIPESLVLTEHDYLKFLVNVSGDPMLIPPQIQKAITGNSLLFLGYKLDDWDFRILLHTVSTYLEYGLSRAHVSVQIVPIGDDATPEQKVKAQQYLDMYFDKLDIKVFWGTCQEFIAKLKEKWESFENGE